MSVTDKVKTIIRIEAGEEARIAGVLPLASLRLKGQLGDDRYAWYLALEDEAPDRDALEYAEAWYTAALILHATRRVYDQQGIASSRNWGQGSITPAPVDDLLKLKAEYEQRGDEIARRYQSPPDDEDVEPGWYDI